MAVKGVSNFGIRDNHTHGKVADFIKDKVAAGSKLSVVSAYFTIYAYEALSTELDKVEQLRFLFGEPRFIASLDPEKTDKKAFKIEDEGLELANRLQQKEVARRCAAWIRDKVEIRSIRQANLLHGKLYHIHDGHREHAILGSSNFTRRGLGLSAIPNIELNLIVDSDRDRAELKEWFDSIWADEKLVADVKDEVLRYLAQLYVNHPPEFIYFKTLFHIFERFLSGQADDAQLFDRTAIVDSEIWKTLFDFQKDGAKGAIHKINAHNGCILADSVGLGKTYTALAVIKYYELRNLRVLVLCPKKLRDNWTVYLAQNNSELNPFLKDRFGYTVLSHTDLSRDTGKVDSIDLAALNWGNYDLIVIDESHNFRNNVKGKRDEEGNVIRKSRYERLMQDIIQSGVKTKARLSALGLAIYLAGRLALVQQATGDAPKLLVLDDVLIGLDHSNRLPVLDVLHTHFADWQVVLLTHDKTWFDLARAHLPKQEWIYYEVYEGDPSASAPMPIAYKVEAELPRALLNKGTSLMPDYCEAAANYARQAFELGMRIACEVIPIEMPFKQSSKNHKSQELLDKLANWKVKGRLAKQGVTQKDWDSILHRLQMFKDVVLNPYSHPSSPNIPKQEIADAIAAVTAFLDLVAKK